MSRKKIDVIHLLKNEITTAQLLISQITDIFGEDDNLIKDSVEGETNLYELMEAVIAERNETKAMIEGIKAYEKKVKARKDSMTKRCSILESLLLNAMQTATDEKTLKLPVATLTRRKPTYKLNEDTLEESEVPTTYFVKPEPEPVLQKKELTDALKEKKAELEEYITLKLADVDISQMTEEEVKEARQEIEDGMTEEEYRAFHIPGAELKTDGESLQIRTN